MEFNLDQIQWLNTVASNRGLLLSEEEGLLSFENGLFMDYPELGKYFIHHDGTISGLKNNSTPHELFSQYQEASVKPLAEVYKGNMVLHGGATKFRDRVISLIGDSGVGKSTLTYLFLNQGGLLICESGLVFPDMGNQFVKTDAYIKLIGNYSNELGSGIRINSKAEKFIYQFHRQPSETHFNLDVNIVLGWGKELEIVSVDSRQQRFAFLHQNALGIRISQRLFPNRLVNAVWNIAEKPLVLFKRPKHITAEESFQYLLNYFKL